MEEIQKIAECIYIAILCVLHLLFLYLDRHSRLVQHITYNMHMHWLSVENTILQLIFFFNFLNFV